MISRYYPGICLEEQSKTAKTDSNRAPLKDDFDALLLRQAAQRCSVVKALEQWLKYRNWFGDRGHGKYLTVRETFSDTVLSMSKIL
jgi:hypothetical protein